VHGLADVEYQIHMVSNVTCFLPCCRNKLRESRNAISSADISDEVQLGVPGEAFNFGQCQDKVTVAEGAASTGNVSAVEQFIREYVKV
jgi:signal recognition particle receptor subunit beta